MNAKPRAKLPSRLGATAPSVLANAMPADLEKAAGPMNLIVDSGSDYHVVGNRDMLIKFEPCSKVAQTAGGNDLDIIGVGVLQVSLGLYTDTGHTIVWILRSLTCIMRLSVHIICCRWNCCERRRYS